jgi:hypothetical protein
MIFSRYLFPVLTIALLLAIVVPVGAIDTEPPASITNVIYNDTVCDQIIFEWDNPTDEDFNGTEYWWNDVKGTNLTAADAPWILFGGLDGGTEYTFSTRTFDTFGNANATFVNTTVSTPVCVSPAAFTSNVTCQIGVPVAVYFEGSCGDPGIKSDWFPGDGMSFEAIDNFTYTYESAGAYTVTHVCTPPVEDASSYTLDIVIGPEGTVCEDDCGGPGSCTVTNSYGEEPNYLIVGATVGILFGMVIFRRNGKE